MQDNQLSYERIDQDITDWSFSGSPRRAKQTLETLKHWGLPKHLSLPLVEYAIENIEAWTFDSAVKESFAELLPQFKAYKAWLEGDNA